ncbi:MAG: ATP-binding cassette domain-containing protein [Burkholderiales bacterium]
MASRKLTSTSRWRSCRRRASCSSTSRARASTSSLVDQLRELLVELNKVQGGSFVVIEHNMDFIMRLCLHVICMVEGKVKAEGLPETVQSNRQVLEAYLGIETTPTIEFDKVVAGYTPSLTILNETTLDARKGEITLPIGPNGAGKSTVLKTLFGLLTPRSARSASRGRSSTAWGSASSSRAASRSCPRDATSSVRSRSATISSSAAIFSGRRAASLAVASSVAERFLRIRERIDNWWLRPCRAASRSSSRIGRALLLRPRVLLIDEPSIGVSSQARAGRDDAPAQARGRRRHRADGRAERAHRAQVQQLRALVLEMGRLALDRPASELLHDPDLNRLFLGGHAKPEAA